MGFIEALRYVSANGCERNEWAGAALWNLLSGMIYAHEHEGRTSWTKEELDKALEETQNA